MQNLQLTPNVKQYFVNALKAIGFSYALSGKNGPKFQQMTEAEIVQFFDHSQTSISDFYTGIKYAVLKQLQLDATCGDFIKEQTAVDRATLQQILVTIQPNGKQGLSSKNCENLLRDLTASGVKNDGSLNLVSKKGSTNKAMVNGCCIDEVVETVIVSLMKGVANQKLTVGEKNEAVNLWKDVLSDGFKKFLIKNQAYDAKEFDAWKESKQNSPRYNDAYEFYRVNQTNEKLVTEVAEYCGDKTTARAIVNTQVDDAMLKYLHANESLLKDSQATFQKRCAAEGKDFNTERMTLGDVLTTAGNAKAQIVAFFQTRAAEQSEQEEIDPKKYETKKENRLGNVLGEQGRAHIKEKTGIGAVVDYDIIKGLKSGKKGPWRGYKALFDRISRFLNQEIYGSVQSVGLTQSIIERENGYSFTPEDAKRSTDEEIERPVEKPVMPAIEKPVVKTDFQAIPAEYCGKDGSLNLAGEFYNKTKARIMYDQVCLSNLPIEAAKYGIKVEDDADYRAEMNYLQDRIATAKYILNHAMPQPNTSDFSNPKYYADLESQIIKKEEYKKVKAVKHLLADDLVSQDADRMMEVALHVFGKTARTHTPVSEQALATMAKDLFNLNSLSAAKKVSGQDIRDMAYRFVVSDVWRNAYGQLDENTLPMRHGKHGKATVIDVLENINDFVVEDLKQNAMKNELEEYNVKMQQAKAVFDQQNAIYESQERIRKEREEIKQHREEIDAIVDKERSVDAGGMTM